MGHLEGPRTTLQPAWIFYTLTITARETSERRSLSRRTIQSTTYIGPLHPDVYPSGKLSRGGVLPDKTQGMAYMGHVTP